MALTLHGTVSDNEVILSRHNSKPLIINGDMNIFQRGTSETGVTSGGYKVADRMYFEIGSLGTWTVSQSTDVPTGQGFKYSQKFDCTTADSSPASSDYLLPLEYHFEGQDLQLLKKGTSSAEPITVAVWLKSNLTGNFILEIWDRENDRQISSALNITSANTWTKFVKSFAGDTSGTLSADSSHRFSIGIWGDAGSSFRGGTLNSSWGAKSNPNRAEGNVSLGSSTDNELYVCGLQMEIGSFDANSMPPFQHDDIGTSLARCQRYYAQFDYADGTRMSDGIYRTTTRGVGNLYKNLPNMRGTASISTDIPAFQLYYGGDVTTNASATSGSGFQVTSDNLEVRTDFTLSSGSYTVGYPVKLRPNGAGALKLSAEI